MPPGARDPKQRSRNPALPCPLAVGIALATALLAARAAAQVVDPNFPAVNGSIRCQVLAHDTLYIGGDFDRVGGVPTGSFAVLDSISGTSIFGWPEVDGPVYCSLPDGEGGWFIGGDFTVAGGQPRSRLAHLLADGSLAGWNPGVNGDVHALALENNTLYVGGQFGMCAGTRRYGLAAVDISTGAALPWSPVADQMVLSLAVHETAIYVGGYFQSVSGLSRRGVAAIDRATAAVLPWDPAGDIPFYVVRSLAVDGSRLLVGGTSTSLDGTQHQGRLAAYDLAHDVALAWEVQLGAEMFGTLAVGGSTVYLAGSFTEVLGQPRRGLAAIDAASGTLLPWNPVTDGEVSTLASSRGVIYVSGPFTKVAGQRRAGLAAIDATSGAALPWDPRPNGPVSCIGTNAGRVFVGGDFGTFGGQARRCLAAINATTGAILPWDPGADGSVTALAHIGHTLYAAGFFSAVGGQARRYAAAIDASTASVLDWNPAPPGPATCIAADRGWVYIGGLLRSEGSPESIFYGYLHAFDATTGARATPVSKFDFGFEWFGVAASLVARGDTIIAGFGWFGPYSGEGVAAWDVNTGAVLWESEIGGTVSCLLSHADTLYAGGSLLDYTDFTRPIRRDVVALDMDSGQPLPWGGPGLNRGIQTLALGGPTLYAGGYKAPGDRNLTAIDAATGAILPWQGPRMWAVLSLSAMGSTLHAGVTATPGHSRSNRLMRIIAESVELPSVRVLAPAGGQTFLIADRAGIRWSATGGDVAESRVDLHLSRFGSWEPIARDLANTGEYDWKVTGPATAGRAIVRVDVRDASGRITSAYSVGQFSIVTSIPGPAHAFTLAPLAPNPVHGPTTLTYALPFASHVRLSVVDVQGRELRVLEDADRPAGRHVAQMPAGELAPGLYFVRMRAPGVSLAQRFVLVR